MNTNPFRSTWAIACIGIVVLYTVTALFAKLGWLATPWDLKVGGSYQHPSLASWPLLFGTDLFGQSVLYKIIQGSRAAMSVGLISCLISVPIGVSLGMIAGYCGGWIDEVVVWLYTTLSSVPAITLLITIVYVLGKGLGAIYLALGLTAWVGLCRIIRGEFLKHKEREYVLAARSLGASHFSCAVRHILPNVAHFIIIDVSIQFMTAIKAEVILSFLGIGVQGQPSWGAMIDDARQELSRHVWWQLASASAAIFLIVLALNVLGDLLRDALDPKVRGSSKNA